MGGHHLGLVTNNCQNAPIAEDENREYNDVEGQEVPDRKAHPSRLARPENCVAVAVHYTESTTDEYHVKDCHGSQKMAREDLEIPGSAGVTR